MPGNAKLLTIASRVLAVIADYAAETAVERELVLRLASVLWRFPCVTGNAGRGDDVHGHLQLIGHQHDIENAVQASIKKGFRLTS